MKRVSGILTAVTALVAVSAPLQLLGQQDTPDISGEWLLTREGGGGGREGGGGGGARRGGGGGGRRGGGGPSALTIEQDGATFTGTLELRFGASDIHDGKIDGTDVSFKVAFESPRGTIEMVYTGTIEGDTMSGTVTGGFGGGGNITWKATRVET